MLAGSGGQERFGSNFSNSCTCQDGAQLDNAHGILEQHVQDGVHLQATDNFSTLAFILA